MLGTIKTEKRILRSLYLVDNCVLSKVVQKRELIKTDIFDVIKEFKTVTDCLFEMEKIPADVVIISLEQPNAEAISATRKIKQNFPDTKVIIHSSRKSERFLLASLVSGANSYVKKTKEYDLAFIVKRVLDEGFYIDFDTITCVCSKLNDVELEEKKMKESKGIEVKPLTKRELEVLTLISQGISNPKIADELGITINTVKTQIRSILEKLEAQDRAQAAVNAVRLKLI